ncbi:hypothetical protein K040078D81_45130 [Blautia hominis]|uniref:histidine kinase n=2 Tax=Blautia hominis TaxID=2025493 RepID=A0ABQ0BFZ9_9FIRM
MGMKAKLMLAFAVLVFFPMLSICLYNYYETRDILIEREYERLDADMNQGIRTLEEKIKDYDTVLDIVYVDRNTHLYLCQDYSNQSFEKMFYYLDSYFQNIMLVQNDIGRICNYSTNHTLPEDGWYFFTRDELPDKMYLKVAEKNGVSDFLGLLKEEGERYFVLGRLMNYYSKGNIRNIMTVQIKSETFDSLLGENSDESKTLLLDKDGTIIASSDKDYQDYAFSGITGILPGRIKNHHVELSIDEETWLCTGKSAENGMMLVKMVRPASIFSNMRKTLNRMLMMMVLVVILVIVAVYYFVGTFTGKVQRIRYMAKQMGAGKFEYRLPDLGKDEFGEIADIFNQLNEEIQKLIYENYEKQLKIKDSYLNLMQEQINPHFLYNALSVISSMAMRSRDRRTVESIQYLASFYRISLNKGKQILTVKDELDLLKNYMKIQLIRFGDRVDITYECEDRALAYHTIKLVLQPLVENAIHHGMKEEGVLHISVSIYRKERTLVMEVLDDGLGVPEDKLQRFRSKIRDSREGFGLINVGIRIKLHYGEKYGIQIESREGRGTKVTVCLPAE